jgi:hypothetical protein
MEIYLQKYNEYKKTVVYQTHTGHGGIGDITKYFTYLLQICIQQNIRLCYLITDYPVNKYLQLKHPQLYIEYDQVQNPGFISNISEIESISENQYYIIDNYAMYSVVDVYPKIEYDLQDIFIFSDAVIQHAIPFSSPYISIHLRLGDHYLETDINYISCPEDIRDFCEDRLLNFIENHREKLILFCCDNKRYKTQIHQKYPWIYITDYDIGHTGLENTTDTQTLNAITEFYMLSNSQEIYSASYSGFSIMAANFRNIPLRSI